MSEIEAFLEDGLVERLNRLIDARRDFVSKRNAMNAAIPEINATQAERALYDERYNADHEAERALFREASNFATWAAEVNPIASLNRASEACASVQRERDALREMLGEAAEILRDAGPLLETLHSLTTPKSDASKTVWKRISRIRAFLSRYEGEVK